MDSCLFILWQMCGCRYPHAEHQHIINAPIDIIQHSFPCHSKLFGYCPAANMVLHHIPVYKSVIPLLCMSVMAAGNILPVLSKKPFQCLCFSAITAAGKGFSQSCPAVLHILRSDVPEHGSRGREQVDVPVLSVMPCKIIIKIFHSSIT